MNLRFEIIICNVDKKKIALFVTQLVTACPVGMLLKAEVLGSRPTNNLIMELEKTHNRGVGVGALQRCEPGAHGRVVPRGGLSQKKSTFFVTTHPLTRNLGSQRCSAPTPTT